MKTAADILIAIVALLHVYFLALEMFLWDKPLGPAGFGIKVFFLACVTVAGIFGALTASRKILWIQAAPAAAALGLLASA